MKSEINIAEIHIDDINYNGSIHLINDNCDNEKTTRLVVNEDFGRYNLSETSLNGIYIYNWESQFNQDLKLTESVASSILSMHFSLEGEVMAHFKNMCSQACKKGQSNIWSITEGEIGHIEFPKDKLFKCMGISLDGEYLKKLTNTYPRLLTKLYNQHLKGESFCLQKNNAKISSDQSFVIAQMKNAQLMGNCCDIYTESKVLELLALQLYDFRKKNNKFEKCCRCIRDFDKIHEAKNILIANSNRPPTILELSKRVGINDHKLKNGFKEVFNQTVYGCLFDYKMNLAHQLLLDTEKTIFEIALDCGYEYASHFTTAFKRKYGVTPKQFKKIM